MRVGQNPAKSVDSVAQPQNITVAVVNYIPVLGGYYAQSLEVLKTCLDSIWANTDLPYDLLVFDNHSCQEVRDYLVAAQQQGKIQYLVLSEKNIGKAGAWNFIFGAAPGEFIAYADSDVYHYPGWLSPQIALFKAFPNLGMVTGMPMWTPAEFSTATVEWAEQSPDASLERGKFLSWEDYWRHSRSLGKTEAEARAHFESVEDTALEAQGVRYFIGAAHFQFVARKSVLQSVLPIPSERPMGQVRLLDVAINQQGYLRLCLPDWHVRHLGNTLEAESRFQGTESPARSPRRAPLKILKSRPIRNLLSWIYHRTFEMLYKD